MLYEYLLVVIARTLPLGLYYYLRLGLYCVIHCWSLL